MVYLSVLSFLAAAIYFYVGYRTYRSNKKSKLCRFAFLLTLSMTIWSFAEGFLYLAENYYVSSFWNKAAAFGWCTFEALALYFVLLITGNKKIRFWYVKLLIILPAPVFLVMVLFLFGPDINTSPVTSTIFYTGNFIYSFTYLAISILLIYLWGHKSKSRIQKKQANIIVVCSTIPLLFQFLFQIILPSLGLMKPPNMGHIFMIIMLLGVNYAIIKYQFLSIPTSLITNQLFHELAGLTFLADINGCIIKANRQVFTLLDYTEDEVIGSNITDIIRFEKIDQILKECEALRELIRYQDINVSLKSGSTIPFNISIIPLRSESDLLLGLLIIGEDIRATKLLQGEIARHKLTNERLKNSEKLFRTLLEVTPIPILLVSKEFGHIRYLNNQAIELLGADRPELLDLDVNEFLVNQEDLHLLIDCVDDDKKPSKYEFLLRRKRGDQFTGLVTVVPSIYQEEEVVCACVIDMTEQKNVEDTLKQNNENISKLNQELMIMNNILANKSAKDGLTNLYNHQYMNEILETTIQEITQTKSKLCVMMLDIDHFKLVNDRFGHQVGDRVLVMIADLLMSNTRKHDYIGRYGGEEFLLVLPDTDLPAAVLIAQRIRSSIAAISDYNSHCLGNNNSRLPYYRWDNGTEKYESGRNNPTYFAWDAILFRIECGRLLSAVW